MWRSVSFTVGVDDLKGLFSPKRFYDSVIDKLHTAEIDSCMVLSITLQLGHTV